MHVTAVVVSHNGSTFLPDVLTAIAGQTRAPDRIIGFDAASKDSSYTQLIKALPEGNVIKGSSRASFGAAVKSALAELDAKPENPEQEYLWLLHDDAAPEPQALAELLGAVERASSVTIAGCKQVDWENPSHLIDVGLTCSHRAERLTMIEVDEQDQGQHDGRTDAFAVNSAGMLIRRDTWDSLGGFDPALPSVGDDLDLCWRNRLSGHRVVVVPTAMMRHMIGRPGSLSNHQAARRGQVHTQLKHCAPLAYPFVWISTFVSGLWRLLAGILFKEPGYGWGQFTATMSGLFRFGAIARGRAVAKRTRRVKRTVIRRLQVDGSEVRIYRRAVGEALLGVDETDREVDSGSNEFEPTGDAANDFASLATARRLWVGTGLVAAVVLTGLLSLVSLNRFLGAAAVSGGAAIPASANLGDIWSHAVSWWTNLGAGSPGHGHPFDLVIWVLGVLGFGNANLSIVLLVLLAMPLAAVGAWAAACSLVEKRWPRFLAGLLWGTTPALTVSLAQGRIGALLAVVLMPWVVLAAVRAVGAARGRKTPDGGMPLVIKPGQYGKVSYTAAAGGGIALAFVTAGAPTLAPLAVILVILAMLLGGRRARALWWMLLPSVALYLPYVVSNLGNWRALLADPGVPFGYSSAPAWLQELGRPVTEVDFAAIPGLSWLPSGVPWGALAALAIGGPVLLVWVFALIVPHRHSATVRILSLVGIAGFVVAFACNFVATSRAPQTLVTSFNGPTLALGAFTVLAGAVFGLEALLRSADTHAAEPSTHQHKAFPRLVATVCSVLLVISPVVAAGTWLAQNLSAPHKVDVQAAGAQIIPATAQDQGQSPARSRTLVISIAADNSYTAEVMRGAGTTLDSLSPAVAAAGARSGATDQDAASATIRKAVATVTAGTGADPRDQLNSLGVNYVVLRHVNTGSELMSSQIDAVPGLAKVGLTDTGYLWRVEPKLGDDAAQAAGLPRGIAAVRIDDASGETTSYVTASTSGVDADIPAGKDGRTLVLSERADSHFTATLDGQNLTSTPGKGDSSWAQAFTLPAEGGHLKVSYQQPWAVLIGVVQIILLALAALMAIPMPANRGRSKAALWSASWQTPPKRKRQRKAARAEKATVAEEAGAPEKITSPGESAKPAKNDDVGLAGAGARAETGAEASSQAQPKTSAQSKTGAHANTGTESRTGVETSTDRQLSTEPSGDAQDASGLDRYRVHPEPDRADDAAGVRRSESAEPDQQDAAKSEKS